MQFIVKHEFKDGHRVFEIGNSHDSKKLGIADESVRLWYQAGWVDIEGEAPGPDIDPKRRVTLEVQNVKLGHSAEKAGVSTNG